MSSVYGADVEHLRVLASQFDRSADRLDADRMSVGNGIRVRAWVGPVAVRFRAQWDSDHSRRMQDAAERLRRAALSLRANADDQEKTSAAGGGALDCAPYPVPRDVHVELSSRTPDDPPRGAWSPGELIDEFGRDGTYSSAITIRTIENPDGTRSHIIFVPGTQDWTSQSSNVFDGADNIGAEHGLRTPGQRAVLEAMRQHGIGPNDAIMLVGHSQGALIAGNLASDPEFRSNYRVEGVLAYGADIRNRDIPAGIAVTQVANGADAVPGLTNLGNDTRAENLNEIGYTRVDLSTRYEHDSSFIGRFRNAGEATVNVINPFDEHNNHGDYARAAEAWFAGHRGEWLREYTGFQTPTGSQSSTTRYGAAD